MGSKLIFFTLLLSIAGVQCAPRSDAGCTELDEEFHEELYVNPLPSGHVNTYFQFTTRWHYGNRANLYNTRLVPRPISEILLQFDLKELHIGLTQSIWRYEKWGYPVRDLAPGAEVWAWFQAPNLTRAEVNDQWIRLTSTFSGILCASFNFIDRTNSIEPQYGFRPQFAEGRNADAVPKFVRYATLPREIVCTENLTPWKKLLPCRSKYGFASLLNSGYIHNTNYHSLGLKVRTICEKFDENCMLEFTETANLVYDPKLLGSDDFSIRRMFGQGLNGYCPLAKSSKIYVNLNSERYHIAPQPMQNITSIRGGAVTKLGVYDIQQLNHDDRLFNLAWLSKANQNTIIISPPPPVYAHRYILGHGQEKGQIITEVTNNHYAAIPVILQEQIPWFVPSYMHTLKLYVHSTKHDQVEIKPKILHYRPGIQRTRPYHLEVGFEVPAMSVVKISFDFDYIFLKWLEYPPDANHGHYLGSAIISTQVPIGRNYTAIPVEGYLFSDSFNATRPSYFLQIRTEALILSLPTPDFSMPYNVICLACTVVALAFGPIHSVTTKRIVIEEKDAAPHSLVGRIKRRFFGKKTSNETKNDDTNVSKQDTVIKDSQGEDNET